MAGFFMNIDQYIFSKNYTVRQLFSYVLFSLLLGWILLWFAELTKNTLPLYIIESPEPIRVVAFFGLLVFLLITISHILKLIVKIFKRNKIYKFRTQDWPKEWIFNGVTILTTNPSGLHVKSSRAGVLLKNYLWKDLKMTFEMQYAGHIMDYLGIVFRAVDLENYFMLEIIKKGQETRVQPLVRYQGAWETSEDEAIGLVDWANFVKVKLEVKNNIVTLYVDSFTYEWTLPTHVDVNHIEAGAKHNSTQNGTNNMDRIKSGTEIANIVPEIPFKQTFGMIGFRAHMGQGAIIKNLTIKPL